MAQPVVKVKAVSAKRLKPRPTPDGTSLEEQMNTFCSTLSAANFLGVTVVLGQGAETPGEVFHGFVIYKV